MNIRVKLTSLFLFLGLIPAILLFYYGFLAVVSSSVNVIGEQQSAVQKSMILYINEYINSYKQNITFVGNLTSVDNFANELNASNPNKAQLNDFREQIENNFVTNLLSNSSIIQQEYIDSSGESIVNVIAVNDEIKFKQDNQLGTYSPNDFKQAIKLNKNEIYISNITLDTVENTIKIPHVPVMQFYTPVFAFENSDPVGVIHLKVRVEDLMNKIKSNEQGSITGVVDEEGYYVFFQDESKLFGNQLNKNNNLKRDFVDLYSILSTTRMGQIWLEGNSILWEKIDYDGNSSEKYWVIYSVVDTSYINKVFGENAYVVAGLEVVSLVLIFFISLTILKSICVPIKLFTSVIDEISKGNYASVEQIKEMKFSFEFTPLKNAIVKMTDSLKKTLEHLKTGFRDKSNDLEKLTKELSEMKKELDAFQQLTTERELRMITLKRKIKKLEYKEKKDESI